MSSCKATVILKAICSGVVGTLILSSCGTIKNFHKYQLGDDVYDFRQKGTQYQKRSKQSLGHRGITAGIFAGIGSTAVTPWTTSNLITDEYNGFIVSRGLAVMIGVNELTVGIGVGWDYLTDRDKDIWIYQNKPWYGLTVGLNLN